MLGYSGLLLWIAQDPEAPEYASASASFFVIST
jgi:hypothetical protein